MCSVRVWPVAGPIKWNRPSVTIRSVFQNPVTYCIPLYMYKSISYDMQALNDQVLVIKFLVNIFFANSNTFTA